MRLALAFVFLAGFAGIANAAPKPDLWKVWSAYAPDSTQTIDHTAFTQFLQKYVVKDTKLKLNRVRYSQVSNADKKALKAYIKRLEGIKITHYNRDVQRAYWMNLYNAETLNLVLEHYPVSSIKKIGGGFFSSGPWDEKLLTVEGKELSLNDIEHRILRPIWTDPLNHYGVNCASVGCPNLRMQAFTGKDVTKALRANATAYINSPRGVRFKDGKLEVSEIYDWFSVDFGGTQQAVISHLRQYAAPALSAKLDAAKGIDGYMYNWSLNDAKGDTK